MSTNPFDGSNTIPIKYSPKTCVVGGTVYKLVVTGPGASFWEDTGVAAPPAGTAPPVAGEATQALIEYVKAASPMDGDAIKIASAISVSRSNANYNAGLYERYVDAFVTWAKSGQGKEPLKPNEYYQLADFNAILGFVMAGQEVPRRPEPPSFNQG